MNYVVEVLDKGWVGSLVGFIGVSFAIYQIFQRNGAKLCFQYMGQLLIDGSSRILPDDVKVTYRKKAVSRLTLTQVVIWNDGRAPIRGTDISETDVLKCKFGEETIILNAEIIKTSRTATIAELEILNDNNNEVLVKFNFLDEKDGFLIKILHTGINQSPKISGTIIGIPKGVQSLGRLPVQRRLRNRRLDGSPENAMAETFIRFMILTRRVMPLLGLIGSAIFLIGLFPGIVLTPEISGNERIGLLIFGFIYGPIVLFASWVDRRKCPHQLTPDEIDL
ncbi:hypothetical protein [Leptospira sarikeiensis]|uniref:Uncharacterized protein n=1 Tax=Leptospira sarikeiensis TaxID=2484943 RepID=A0A4R9K6G4_9LEPT|nr:hypothetical protein [Leptospira sarikeiensis]TGL61181.1 hypothetical protein EHQ64_11235 [Leptospira sarikeiensis]